MGRSSEVANTHKKNRLVKLRDHGNKQDRIQQSLSLIGNKSPHLKRVTLMESYSDQIFTAPVFEKCCGA